MSAAVDLLFDLGGVIIDLDREACVRAFGALGLRDAAEMLDPYAQSGVFALLEEGRIGPAEFYDELRRHAGRPELTDQELERAFTSFLGGLPRERLQALRSLRRRHRVFLLSNTNPVMMQGRIRRLFRQEGLEMEDYFDGMALSYQAGCCKPEAGIFHYAARMLGLRPEATVFFDDSQANVDAARALGFRAVRVTN